MSSTHFHLAVHSRKGTPTGWMSLDRHGSPYVFKHNGGTTSLDDQSLTRPVPQIPLPPVKTAPLRRFWHHWMMSSTPCHPPPGVFLDASNSLRFGSKRQQTSVHLEIRRFQRIAHQVACEWLPVWRSRFEAPEWSAVRSSGCICRRRFWDMKQQDSQLAHWKNAVQTRCTLAPDSS